VVLYDFLSGAVAFGFFACALFFVRFWRRTREQLFLAFSCAFALLGIGQTVIALAQIPTEEKGALYLIRLVAFLLILVAIYRKNRPSQRT
jgi:uncharacterized membrane protein